MDAMMYDTYSASSLVDALDRKFTLFRYGIANDSDRMEYYRIFSEIEARLELLEHIQSAGQDW